MGDLTLPGDIPGLLRRGSPLIVPCLPTDSSAALCDTSGMFGGTLWADALTRRGCTRHRADKVALDLTDATGRVHAAWWLASWWFRVTLDATSPAAVCAIWRPLGARWWTCAWPGASLDAGPGGGSRPLELDVPALAGLDPDDPRMLPDGSRWVDADALRLVCLYVAGRVP
jgi:hypothetical protein